MGFKRYANFLKYISMHKKDQDMLKLENFRQKKAYKLIEESLKDYKSKFESNKIKKQNERPSKHYKRRTN